jgi:hypothetical protein
MANSVTANAFILQDEQGNSRAVLQVGADRRVSFNFLNKDGKQFASLFESFEGDGVLYLFGQQGNCFMSLFAEAGNPTVFIDDANGKILTLDAKGVHQQIASDQTRRLAAEEIVRSWRNRS